MSAPSIVPLLIDAAAEAWKGLLNPAQLHAINGRLERGVALAKNGNVETGNGQFTFEPNTFKVRSGTVKGNLFYWVNLGASPRTCTCPDYPDAPYHVCKHIVAAHLIKKALELHGDPAPSAATVENGATGLAATAASGDASFSRPAFESDLLNNQVLDETAQDAIAPIHPKPETFIYAWLEWGEQLIPVQIESIENGQCQVRALPVIEGDEIRPIFPFTSPIDGAAAYSTAIVTKDLLYNVKVYRKV